MATGTAVAQPRFVNAQSVSVGVYDAKGKKIYVEPFRDQSRSKQEGAIFVVEGEHYRTFAAPRGPLSPFPGQAAKVSPLPASVAGKPAASTVANQSLSASTPNPGVVASPAAPGVADLPPSSAQSASGSANIPAGAGVSAESSNPNDVSGTPSQTRTSRVVRRGSTK